MIVLEPTRFVIVVSITASNENISHPVGVIIVHVSEHGNNSNVVLFARQL